MLHSWADISIYVDSPFPLMPILLLTVTCFVCDVTCLPCLGVCKTTFMNFVVNLSIYSVCPSVNLKWVFPQPAPEIAKNTCFNIKESLKLFKSRFISYYVCKEITQRIESGNTPVTPTPLSLRDCPPIYSEFPFPLLQIICRGICLNLANSSQNESMQLRKSLRIFSLHH